MIFYSICQIIQNIQSFFSKRGEIWIYIYV